MSWPMCCGLPMWWGPRGHACWTCPRADTPPLEVELPDGEQLALL